MSSIPTGAAVIQFQADMSKAYADLNAFRAEAGKPITISGRADFAGPGGTGGGSMGVASASGPATFANPNGQAAYVGPGGASGITASRASLAYGSGSGYGGAGGMGGRDSQLTSATQQLSQSIQQLTQAIGGRGAMGAAAAGGAVAEAETAGASTGRRGRQGFLPRTIRGAFSSAGSMIGGLPGIGLAFGMEAGREFLTTYATAEHENEMSRMMGATPADMARQRLAQVERIRGGGFMGLNPLFQAAGDRLAKNGFNPGGVFTWIPEEEKRQTEKIRGFEQRDFLHDTRRGEREIGGVGEDASEPNPFIRRRNQARRAGGERNLQILERFTNEQFKYEPGSDRWNALNREGHDALGNSMRTNQAVDRALDRDEGYQRQRRESQATVAAHLEQRNGLEASREVLRQQYREAVRNAAPGENFQILSEFEHRYQTNERQHQDRFNLQSAGLAASNESMRIAIGTHPEKPALGAAIGAANTIYRRAILGAYAASHDESLTQPQRERIERQELAGGQLGLREFKQNFRRGLSTESIDSINQQSTSGPGTTSPGELLTQIEKMVNAMAAIQANLSQLTSNVQQLLDE